MDIKVKKIIDQYRANVELFKHLGADELHAKIIQVMEKPGFVHACEYFAANGFDDSAAIDTRISGISTDFTMDQLNAGIEPGPELTRESLAYAYGQLDGFPDDAKEVMIEMGEIAISMSFGAIGG